jgi:preprotein translocase subunit YajC
MNAVIVIVILFALVWLLLLRPQRRRAAQQRELMSGLEPGDEIVSTGGIYGVIASIEGDELHVEIADGLVVRMARGAVAGLVERDEEPEETESDEDQESVKAGDEPPNPS